jgi:hypothetical protein
VNAYRYVGPAELRGRAVVDVVVVRSRADLDGWLAARDPEPFTFVVDLDRRLRLAPRRSEHVTCAGGEPVLSAGEIAFSRDATGWLVDQVTNQSTGYCPEPASWGAVAAALDAAGVRHPGRFTDEVVFRRCPGCGERNVVRDGDFVCAVCGGDLPTSWNC